MPFAPRLPALGVAAALGMCLACSPIGLDRRTQLAGTLRTPRAKAEDTTHKVVVSGGYPGSSAGLRLHAIADVDGDSVPDVAAVFPRFADKIPSLGGVVGVDLVLISGDDGTLLGRWTLDTSRMQEVGRASLGGSLALVANSETGAPHRFIIGAPFAYAGAGAIYSLLLPLTDDETPASLIELARGTESGQRLGGNVLVSAARLVVSAATSGLSHKRSIQRPRIISYELSDSQPLRVLYSIEGAIGLGFLLHSIGDINGDSDSDLITTVAAPRNARGLAALSGATGDILWTWEPDLPQFAPKFITTVQKDAGTPEIMMAGRAKGENAAFRLRLDARTGALIEKNAGEAQFVFEITDSNWTFGAIVQQDHLVLIVNADGAVHAEGEMLSKFTGQVVYVPGVRNVFLTFEDELLNQIEKEGSVIVVSLR